MDLCCCTLSSRALCFIIVVPAYCGKFSSLKPFPGCVTVLLGSAAVVVDPQWPSAKLFETIVPKGFLTDIIVIEHTLDTSVVWCTFIFSCYCVLPHNSKVPKVTGYKYLSGNNSRLAESL